MPKRQKSRFRFNLQTKLLLGITVFILFGVGTWAYLRSQVTPSAIDVVTGQVVDPGFGKPIRDQNGCYYRQVECIKAPCPQVLVCPTTPTTSDRPTPAPSLIPTPKVSPIPSSLPTTPACAKDATICPDGSIVGRTGPNCEFVCPTVVPSATPRPTIAPTKSSLLYLEGTNPCGTGSFSTYTIKCLNGSTPILKFSSCTPLDYAYVSANQACNGAK